MRKTVSSTALWAALVVSLGVSVSACSGDSEVLAVERVDAAAQMARESAPEAEDFGFAETESMLTAMATPEVAADDIDAEADETAAVEVSADSADTEGLAANAGEQLYNNACTACHANGLLNAPVFADSAAWAPRIEKGLDTLTMHSAEGYNQMPAQAIGDITEAQVRAAVEYMVDAAS